MPYTVKSGDNLWSIWSSSGGGMSWADFKNLNVHLQRGGSNWGLIYAGDVVKLPGDTPAAPAPSPAAPAPTPAPVPAPAPSPTPSFPMLLEPEAYLKLQETILELQRQEAEARDAREKERIAIERERLESLAREMELRLSTTPIDFVAYELYKREKEAADETLYTGPSASDVDIQAMVAAMVGEGAGSLGVGEFGVEVPTTQSISRAESLRLSPDEMDILGSFLKAGFDVNGQEVSYDPVDYWREVEQGFIPTIQTPAMTRYAF